MNTHTTIAEADRAIRERVLDLVLREGCRAVVVESPPGAGKTGLVESVAAAAVRLGRLRVAIVAPRAAQTYDLVRRLLRDYQLMPVQQLVSKDRILPSDLLTESHANRHYRIVTAASGLIYGPGVMVSTASKLFSATRDFSGTEFDLLICDEAYQLRYKDFAPLLGIARQVLLVGDPGQLPPLNRASTARFEGAPHHVHWPVPVELLRRLPDLPKLQLPATYRLPQDTVDLVQPAFYREMRFESMAGREDRRVSYAASGMHTAIDRALNLLADGASVVGLILPARDLPGNHVDDGVAAAAADTVHRLLERGATWVGTGQIRPCDVGCVDAHVASGAATRRQLRSRGLPPDEVMVDTPEIWQGLQRPIMIVKHPLSAEARLDEFSLEPGRMCVALSRHLLGCVVVARDGVGEVLNRHNHDCADVPLGAHDAEWAGWNAHHSIWTRLERLGRLVRV
jgi:hypothetical protein